MEIFAAVTTGVVAVLFSGYRAYFEILEAIARRLNPRYTRPPVLQKLLNSFSGGSIDERIKKIDIARENLKDALAALDDLGRQAEVSKTELNSAMQKIAEIESEKKQAASELELLKEVVQVDTESFRRIVGLPSGTDVWRERLLGFGSGVLASLLAAFLYASIIALSKLNWTLG
jgi:peptidoglycan hydrolase CwlO-like protein